MNQRVLLVFLGVCLCLLVGVSAAQEAEPGAASVLLFVAALGRNSNTWSIVMLDPQAEGPERLTDDQYDEFLPSASADGRYVVFLRGHFEIDDPLEYYVLDRDCLPECEPRRLPDGAQGLRDLRWSPIAPQLVGWGVDNALWLVDIEKDTVEQIIGGKWNAYPAWSPDGSMIVMSSDVVPEEAVLSDDIQAIPAQVDASPDDRINLTYSGKFVEETIPRWSPDGLWIAYVTHNIMPDETDPFSDNPTALIVLDAGCVKATETCLDSRRLLSQDGHSVADFAWSPDSRYLVYLQGEWFGVQNPVGDLWIVELDSGEVTQLTEGQTSAHFAWSPDSRAVVYERVTENSLDVYLAYVDGSRDPGPVLRGFRASATPYWTPQH